MQDQYVRCVVDKHNGPVWQDSCVEFFFAPNPNDVNKYFNIEINCNGYANMAFQRVSKIDYDLFTIEDIEETKIANTISEPVIKETDKPIEWFIESRLPFGILAKYTGFQNPGKGDMWRANFFKCAENNSHPHWLSWAKMKNLQPDFHLPQYMNVLKFY